MLKGLKKTKPAEQSHNNQHKLQKTLINKHEPNDNRKYQQQDIQHLVSRQKDMKNQYIMQEQQNDLYEHKNNQMRMQPNNIIQPINQFQDELRQKAFQIINLFQLGNQKQVRNKITSFQMLQQKVLKNIKQEKFQLLQEKIKQQKPKGKFQYTMNFEQSQQQKQSKKNSKKRHRPKMVSQRIQQYCIYCPDNQQLQLLSASNYVYLSLPKRKTFKKYWHLILAPVQHQKSCINLNDDVITQINNYKKCLLQMFDKKNFLVVFFEQFSQQNSHIYIECLAVPYSKGQDFPFFFKQALESVQGNWTTHKNIIKIQKEKGGLQKQIPSKMKYFYIDFSLGYGYAHVIQNQQYWKRDFVYEVLATPLNLELYEIKTAAQYTDEENQQKNIQFKKMWQAYDWTKML